MDFVVSIMRGMADMRKVLLIALTFVGALVLAVSAGTSVSAATSGAQFGWDNSGLLSATNDGTTLSFTFDKGTSNWSNITQYYVQFGAKKYCVKVEGNNLTAQDMTANWQSLGTVGTATTSANGNITGKIDLAKLNIKQATTAQTITFSADGIGSTTTQLAANTDANAAAASSSSSAASSSSSVVNSSSSNSTSSSSSVATSSSSSTNAASQALAGSSSDQPAVDPAQANNNNTSGSLGITINGNFSDWKDITKTVMHFNGDNDNLKDVALLADQNNIYFYVAMKPH